MDWNILYKKHIEKCQSQNLLEGEYYEKHHIIPKYQGGGNESKNLVKLTHHQHIMAHYILWRLYGNLEDKIAYKMMQGQTIEGRILKQELAIKNSLKYGREYVTKMFKDEKKVEEIMIKRRETRCKNNNGNYYSQVTLHQFSENTPLKCLSKESIEKRKKSHKKTLSKMTPEERSLKFGKHKENHPFWGKERKGEKAANYGQSKGSYKVWTPEGEILHFKSLKEIMSYGFDEKTTKNWRNKGTIAKPKTGGRPSKWVGYTIEYKQKINKNG